MNVQVMRAAYVMLLCIVAQPAWSQSESYPSRPIRFIAANAPGGGLDITARAVSPKLSAALGQQVIVDNRAGAAGSVASDIVSKSAPDGYTIMVGSVGGLAVNTNLYKGLTYDPLRDLVPVALIGIVPCVVVVAATTPVRSAAELVAYARANRGKLSFSSSGMKNACAGPPTRNQVNSPSGWFASRRPRKFGMLAFSSEMMSGKLIAPATHREVHRPIA